MVGRFKSEWGWMRWGCGLCPWCACLAWWRPHSMRTQQRQTPRASSATGRVEGGRPPRGLLFWCMPHPAFCPSGEGSPLPTKALSPVSWKPGGASHPDRLCCRGSVLGWCAHTRVVFQAPSLKLSRWMIRQASHKHNHHTTGRIASRLLKLKEHLTPVSTLWVGLGLGGGGKTKGQCHVLEDGAGRPPSTRLLPPTCPTTHASPTPHTAKKQQGKHARKGTRLGGGVVGVRDGGGRG